MYSNRASSLHFTVSRSSTVGSAFACQCPFASCIWSKMRGE
jgi:hypothetical protein